MNLARTSLARSAVGLCLLSIVPQTLSAANGSTAAQVPYRDFLMQSAPYPIYHTPERTHYNLKWGRLTGRFRGSIQTEFTDNVNLSQDNPQADFALGPDFGIGFLWPLSKANVLHLDVGFGYRWHSADSRLNSFYVAPSSRLDYRILFDHGQVNFYDSFSVETDPTSRPEISGVDAGFVVFRRFNNTLGAQAEWQPARRLSLLGGYSYSISRSLGDDFSFLDRNQHSFNAGLMYSLSPRWRAGVNGSYTITEFIERVQNNGHSYSIGPVLSWRASEFLTFDASAGYTVSTFDRRGTVADASEFGGLTFQVGAHHVMNRYWSHNLRASQSAVLGLGSNFSETFSLQYGLTARLTSAITLNSTLVYDQFETSLVGGERAQRFLCYLQTSYRITRQWSAGAAYSFALKDSDLPGRDYLQNRVSLELTRHF